MTRQHKILWIIGLSLTGVSGLTFVFVVPSIQRGKIRERLDKAFTNPVQSGAIGGIESLQASSAFDPQRFQSSNKATISRTDAISRAKKIWKNYGSWYSTDNESAIVNAFDGLGHYDDLSKIAYYFEQEYDSDLFTVLQDALSGDKQQTQLLMGKINALPKD